jgi:hypothetical protein
MRMPMPMPMPMPMLMPMSIMSASFSAAARSAQARYFFPLPAVPLSLLMWVPDAGPVKASTASLSDLSTEIMFGDESTPGRGLSSCRVAGAAEDPEKLFSPCRLSCTGEVIGRGNVHWLWSAHRPGILSGGINGGRDMRPYGARPCSIAGGLTMSDGCGRRTSLWIAFGNCVEIPDPLTFDMNEPDDIEEGLLC